MGIKVILSAAVLLLVLASAAEGRNYYTHRSSFDNSAEEEEVPVAGRHPHPATRRVVATHPHQQGRVFPGAVAIKKLVLLKFKKVIPISLILLKSSNENEAELVPVYPTSEIPADVQFIPTPNGISGHKDVQAIAIPTELHAQLEANGLANLENIEALLKESQEEHSNTESTAPVAPHKTEDEPLNVKEEDENQLLEGVVVPAPVKASTTTTLRRFPSDEVRTGLKTSPHTTVEEIPLFLYSGNDVPPMIYHPRKTSAHRRRFHN